MLGCKSKKTDQNIVDISGALQTLLNIRCITFYNATLISQKTFCILN